MDKEFTTLTGKEQQKKKEDRKALLYDLQESASEDDTVMEAGLKYASKRQGEFTLADYYALPDDQRVELIDGVIYDMAAPNTAHQAAVIEISFQLESYVRSKEGSCLVFPSPVDVQLDCDERTMVQPDVLVVCDRDKVIRRCVYGAPDMVVEIISPSSERKDRSIKLAKYINAGVREYWIVDLRQEKVIVYDIEHDCRITIYGMDKTIPVQIFGGDCKVSFERIIELVRSILNSPGLDES